MGSGASSEGGRGSSDAAYQKYLAKIEAENAKAAVVNNSPAARVSPDSGDGTNGAALHQQTTLFDKPAESVPVVDVPSSIPPSARNNAQSLGSSSAALAHDGENGNSSYLPQHPVDTNNNHQNGICVLGSQYTIHGDPNPTVDKTTSHSANGLQSQHRTKFAQPQVKGGKNDDIFKRMMSKYYNITTDTKVAAPEPPKMSKGVTKSGQSASECHWAAYNGDIDKLQSLLDLQGESEVLDSLGRSALFYAACQGHYDACAFLIDHRHEWANVSDRKGDTPMHVASYYKHNRIVELLVQSAVDVSIRNNKGYIPLHVTESVATLKLLIEYGSDVMSVCKKGRTALFCAAATGRISCLRHLCSLATQYPRLVNLADHRGDTALHAAAANGNLDCVKSLLEVAASTNAKNVRGLTPAELAERNNHGNVLEILRPGFDPNDGGNLESQASAVISQGGSLGGQAHAKMLNEVYDQPVAGFNKFGYISERNYSNDQNELHGSAYQSTNVAVAFTERLPSNEDKDLSKLQAILHPNSTSSRSSSTVQNDSYRADDDVDDEGLKRLQSIVNTPGRAPQSDGGDTNGEEDSALQRLQSVVNTPGRAQENVVKDDDVQRLLRVVNSSREDAPINAPVQQRQWIEMTDPESGHMYYQNVATGESQWERPY
eukprot:g4885.t1